MNEPTAQPRDERTDHARESTEHGRRLPTLDEQDWPDRPAWPGRGDWRGRD